MSQAFFETSGSLHWTVATVVRLVNCQIWCAQYLQHVFLLAVRAYWGWQFFLTGKGKLLNLDRTAQFFASLEIPLPTVNAVLAGGIECIGGLLLLGGLASRLIGVPLCFTMIVAYVTAHRSELLAAFSNPEGFLAAPPFLFLMASMSVALFGPGAVSIDAGIRRAYSRNTQNTSST